jgi:hypothetical protein
MGWVNKKGLQEEFKSRMHIDKIPPATSLFKAGGYHGRQANGQATNHAAAAFLSQRTHK